MNISFKQIVLFAHRWLGLISGLVVLVLSITGCLFVFQQEISEIIRHDTFYADDVPAHQMTLPVAVLEGKAEKALGTDHLPYGITTYKNPEKNWSALLYKGGIDSWTYFGMMEVYKTVYINPYTGDIEGIVNEKTDFFQIVKGIHWSLLLSTPIGQPIVVWSTVIFLVLLVTGMVLWWPKRWNKSGRQKSFNIKLGSSWRRLNYDLHNVLGFYFLIVALIIGLTGLYWYFPSAKKGLYFLGTGEFKLPPEEHKEYVSATSPEDGAESPLQIAYRKAWNQNPAADRISFVSPTNSSSTIIATVYPDGQTYYEHFHLYYDQYTGELIAGQDYDSKNAGEKLIAMNYDIHVGAIGGLPGKIIAFLASLVCGSLPVTGFIIWWDRRKRKQRPNPIQQKKRKAAMPRKKQPSKKTAAI